MRLKCDGNCGAGSTLLEHPPGAAPQQRVWPRAARPLEMLAECLGGRDESERGGRCRRMEQTLAEAEGPRPRAQGSGWLGGRTPSSGTGRRQVRLGVAGDRWEEALRSSLAPVVFTGCWGMEPGSVVQADSSE